MDTPALKALEGLLEPNHVLTHSLTLTRADELDDGFIYTEWSDSNGTTQWLIMIAPDGSGCGSADPARLDEWRNVEHPQRKLRKEWLEATGKDKADKWKVLWAHIAKHGRSYGAL